MAALAIGAGRAIYGAVSANQLRQRNKGFINQSYDLASKQLDYRQAGEAENTNEGLAARGITGGTGSGANPITNAVLGRVGPRDIGSQAQAYQQEQFGLERTDLTNQRNRALSDTNAQATNQIVGSIASGVETGAEAYGASKDAQLAGSMQTPGAPGAAPVPSASQRISGGGDPIRSAMLSSISFGGIHPTDPLGDSSSSWHMPPGGPSGSRGGNRMAIGESNADFNEG